MADSSIRLLSSLHPRRQLLRFPPGLLNPEGLQHLGAHQLDGLSGHTNGIPILRKGQAYAGWERAMLDAFEDQVQRVENGERTLIDPYGASSHQEFFAEAIVTFFERPRAMRDQMPALYDQLGKLLALDPAQWH